MDPLFLLAILSLISLRSQVAYGDPSVVFLDSPTRNYLRPPSAETDSLTLSEVGAAASVLLGFPPPSTLSAASSSKLNEVLMPNPFDRPHSVFMIEVTGVEDSLLMVGSEKSAFSSSLRVKVLGSEDKVDIQLSDENEVSLISLTEQSRHAEHSDKELSDFASWLGGSYVEDATGPLNGELTFPIANGALLRLRMSEKADREFTTSLMLLINNIQRAMEMHKGLSESRHRPAELITGRFDGIKVLKDHYGTEGVSQDGLELFVSSVSRIYDSLQAAYKGQLVGVIVCGGPHAPASENMLNVMVASRPSARWLEENEASAAFIKIAEVALVRKTLAWITGIILLISTLLGIYFLLNMPLTKDTLLYSNVKLD
ncbi:unnamed protein product [Fraxinus pennsylvanica]|uniref:DUF7794 domain-containing protein n=1 Tax=Fraxinus pennsylvanica TaxID=56036 RepID=A0AAD1ZZ72_9LAMI|nr:unnamed protein product [Fraxinus pennsylvanica]